MKQLTVVRPKFVVLRAWLRIFAVALFCATSSFIQPAAAHSPAAISEVTRLEALRAHNAVRRRVAQAESQRLGSTVDIPTMQWSKEIAVVAQDWADKQALRLQAGQSRPEHRPNNAYGENMFWQWSEPNLPDESPIAAITWWDSEQQYYDYDANTCTAPADKTCGHYTQLVWSASGYLGCGQSTWSQDGKNYVLWVCNYSSAGNIIGQRPYSVRINCPFNWPRWLRLGSQGSGVIELKSRLNVTGANLGVGSRFDNATDKAVRRFQADRNLIVDGIVGPQTQGALNTVCPKYKKLRRTG